MSKSCSDLEALTACEKKCEQLFSTSVLSGIMVADVSLSSEEDDEKFVSDLNRKIAHGNVRIENVPVSDTRFGINFCRSFNKHSNEREAQAIYTHLQKQGIDSRLVTSEQVEFTLDGQNLKNVTMLIASHKERDQALEPILNKRYRSSSTA